MNKKTLILGGALIILIALAYIYQGPLRQWRANLGKPDNFLAKIDTEQISKMEIIKDSQTTILERESEKWKVGGTNDFYVKDSVIDNAIQSLKKAAEGELRLVSSNKEKKSVFKTDESGIRVKLYQAGELAADFIIGKTGSDFVSTYISLPDADNTYAVKANLFSSFNQNEWRDRTIFSSDKEKIAKIRFQHPNREFAVEKVEGIWQGTSPYKFDVDENKIDKILNIMSNLTAVKIPEQNFEGTGLDKRDIIVQATGEGIDNTIMIGDENDEGYYYAKRADSDNIYLISKWQRDELNKQIWELK
jgi:hypothetical protein